MTLFGKVVGLAAGALLVCVVASLVAEKMTEVWK